MKESGLEKLIELLNEWEFERVNHNTKEYIPYGEKSFNDLTIAQIISKKYGFIQRLVENDKIDRDKTEITAITEIMLATNYNSGIEVKERYWVYEQLIMLLSISDTPIDDLCGYLK